MKNSIETYHAPFAIIKTDISNTWICRVKRGRVKAFFDFSDHNIKEKTVFVVQEGMTFRADSENDDSELEIIMLDESLMNVVYSLLGSEADFGNLDYEFFSTSTIQQPYSKLFTNDYESLKASIELPDIVARTKMITAVVFHIVLTLYNAVASTQNLQSAVTTKRSRQIVNRFFELVSQNLRTGSRNVSFYAQKLCITERYLFKICKNETGKTPKLLIDEMLLGEIKNSLIITADTLQQIADRFKFPDISSFGQFFKRQTGMSPKVFRERYK